MIKKWRPILISTLCMLSVTVTPVLAEDPPKQSIYQDIGNHWAEEAIESLFNAGAIRTSTDQPFEPDRPITKADFLYMLLTTKGIVPHSVEPQAKFSDVPSNSWYFPYVETAYRLGIIHGNGASVFGPETPLTRQEAVTILIRALGEGPVAEKFSGYHAVLSKFADGDAVADWAEENIGYAVQKGYFSGKEKDGRNLLLPLAPLTRAEATTLVYRTLYKRQQMETLKKEELDGMDVFYFAKVHASASAYSKEENGSRTALGWQVREGIVSVDPNVIPFGTHLYIPGYGFAVAGDQGSSIKNLKVDLYMNTRAEALKFGRKNDITIYILDPIALPASINQ